MPHNMNMSLGQRRLFVFFLSVFAATGFGCKKSYDSVTLRLPENRDNPFAQSILKGDWKAVERLADGSSDPFVQLILLQSLFEQKKYSEVLKKNLINDSRFNPYSLYLRQMAAGELKKWDLIIVDDVPADLPGPLQEKLLKYRGQAFEFLHRDEDAKKTYEHMIKAFPRGVFRDDALGHLADLEIRNSSQEKASDLLSELYSTYPFHKDDMKTKKILIQTGRFNRLPIEKHLQRIGLLKKSAAFQRARREVDFIQKNLLQPIDPIISLKIKLALAQVHFSDKKYAQVEKLARLALKNNMPADLEVDWRQILASALIRQDKGPAGNAEYEKLLQKKIPSPVREAILYRLGMSNLDDGSYAEAAKMFEQIRDMPSASSYVESAHWFGAWSLLQTLKDNPQNDPVRNETMTLLSRLPHLVDGAAFFPQAIFWEHQIANDPEIKKEKLEELKAIWGFSFYNQLLLQQPFSFLKLKSNIETSSTVSSNGHNEEIPSSISESLSWQRLELFRAVNLKPWAKLELEEFISSFRRKSKETQLAVAKRLRHLEAWDILVKWADRFLPISLNEINLTDPLVKFHYPKAYEIEVLKAAKEFHVSPFLIWGVMREESRFQPDIVSWAGAIGLMQLMPFRGEKVASTLGESLQANDGLRNPRRNIRLGTYHLKEIERQVSDLPVSDSLKPILQVAVYNAGLDPVRKWIRDKDISSIEYFIESIPYGETRQYVKRVLQSAHIYYLLYQKKNEGDATDETHG